MELKERPKSLEQLEEVYLSMKKHLHRPDTWTSQPILKERVLDPSTCLAIYTLGPWKLHAPSWKRLTDWMRPFLAAGILYSVEGSGNLHFTLHQCSHFDSKKTLYDGSFLAPLINELAGLRILFRGLIVTPTGIALRGYPSSEHGLQKIMSVRNRLHSAFGDAGIPFEPPYINDLCHATLFRWTSTPSEEMIDSIQKGIDSWSECILAEITPYRWSFGYGSLRMIPNEITEMASFWTPEKVAHRGLCHGPNKKLENSLITIRERCEKGLSTEIDIWWHNDGFWIGHDEPREPVVTEFLNSEFLWIHAKNAGALYHLQRFSNENGLGLRIFYHTDESYALTTTGETIILPGLDDVEGWIYMMPEVAYKNNPETGKKELVIPSMSGKICSDY